MHVPVRPPIRLLSLVLLAAASGCGGDREPAFRQYTEVTSDPPATELPPAAPPVLEAGDPLTGTPVAPPPAAAGGEPSWTAPEGWEERPGSGFRLVTFMVPGAEDGTTHECWISVLRGHSGSPEGNLTRWAEQIGPRPGPDQLRRLVENRHHTHTASGHHADIYDLRILTGPEASSSMLAAIIPAEGSTYFARLNAPGPVVGRARSAFIGLVESLNLP